MKGVAADAVPKTRGALDADASLRCLFRCVSSGALTFKNLFSCCSVIGFAGRINASCRWQESKCCRLKDIAASLQNPAVFFVAASEICPNKQVISASVVGIAQLVSERRATFIFCFLDASILLCEEEELEEEELEEEELEEEKLEEEELEEEEGLEDNKDDEDEIKDEAFFADVAADMAKEDIKAVLGEKLKEVLALVGT